ncbi:MAG: hypothetical protein QW165_03400 [Candidatus Woesearchaeota archaeon]
MNKTTFIIGLILLAGGLVFSVLPHEAHNTVLGLIVHEHADATPEEHEHGSHDVHLYLGYGVAMAGLLLVILGYRK